MRTINRRQFILGASSFTLVSQIHNLLITPAHAKPAYPVGWGSSNIHTALYCTSLYIKGKEGWFDHGAKHGAEAEIKGTSKKVEFVTHGEHSKKWFLAKEKHNKSFYLVFRGTQSERQEDIAADLSDKRQTLPKEFGGNGEYVVPYGFYTYWKSLAEELEQVLPHLEEKGWKYHITGFSLGGVFAVYAAWYLHHVKKVGEISTTYTFGSPPCANKSYSNAVTSNIPHSIYRVIGSGDPVPTMKPLWKHVGKEINIWGGTGHSIENYQKRLEKYL